jgi:hypothetical protein
MAGLVAADAPEMVRRAATHLIAAGVPAVAA